MRIDLPSDRNMLVPISLFLVLMTCVRVDAADAADSGNVFVSGFDRFARHGELLPRDAGALLVSELNCVACHPASEKTLSPKSGPNLSGAGNRLHTEWLRRYLANPNDLKPGTTMPHVLAAVPDQERIGAINALVAFLTTQQQPFAVIKATGAVPVMREFWNRGDPEQGRELYHAVGCVACHQPDETFETSASPPSAIDQMIDQLDPEELADFGLAGAARRVDSVPHGDLVAKYSKRSLTMFLFDPAKMRAGARMPSLRLLPFEAADIAAYLLEKQTGDTEAARPIDDRLLVEKGRDLFVTLRCVNCHQASDVGKPLPAKPLAKLDLSAEASCLANPANNMPRYQFDADQVDAIKARLKSDAAKTKMTAAEQVHFRMLQLNCYACHQRDSLQQDSADPVPMGGVGRYRKPYFETVGHVDLGDEGRLPPPLAGVGRKLLPSALKSVFDKRTPPYRRHMTIRMPSYHGDAVAPIVSLLPEADHVDSTARIAAFEGKAGDLDSGTLADIGRQLAGTGCIECHPFGGESLPGVVGVDLEGIPSRVRPEWFYEFVLNPADVKSRTRMPTFFPDGKSNRKDLLHGDVPRQIAALWRYLKDLKNQPLPEKIAKVRSMNYELSPEQRPIVLRTFMHEAGTHAIAVGFPEGVHYAFDSEQMRLATGWKGRFLDARGTWFERFTPPADPLGTSAIEFPKRLPFALAEEDFANWPTQSAETLGYRFGGYRLDESGVPTLLYQYKNWKIEDRIKAISATTLRRTWTLRHNDESVEDDSLVLFLLAGKSLKRAGPMSFTDSQGLTVTVKSGGGSAEKLQQTETEMRWIVPLLRSEKQRIDKQQSDEQQVVVEYTW